MKVYIPFDDGSAVSYDGKGFTVYRRPVSIDADLSDLPESMAERAWSERRKEVVKALEAAWWKEHKRDSESKTKVIYAKPVESE
jgi:hypothetical protein